MGLLIGGLASAGGGIAAGAMESGAAKSAANAQAQAADEAAQLQATAEQNALDFQKQQWNTTQGEIQPFLQSGTGALAQLDTGMGITPTTAQNFSVPAPNVASAPAPAATPQYVAPQAVPLSSLVSAQSTPGALSASQEQVLQGAENTANQVSQLAPRYQRTFYYPGADGVSGNFSSPDAYVAAVRAALEAQSSTPAAPVTQPSAVPLSSLARPMTAPSTTSTTGTSAPAPAPTEQTATAQPTNAQQVGTATNLVPGSLNEAWATPFNAPTAAEAAQTPGYQFQLQQGEQAIQRSAAAQGNLLTGGTLKDLNDYAQGIASQNYQQVYNNALQQYQQAYNIFQNNQNTQYNRLAGIAGLGQTSTGQLASAGNSTANSVANTTMAGANAQAQELNNAAAATASGYVGSANAIGGAIQNGMSSLNQLALLRSLSANAGGAGTLTPQSADFAS